MKQLLDRYWLLILGAIVFFTTPQVASQLNVSPDSVEYAVIAHKISLGESPTLSIAGAEFPSRYPLLFSKILSPFYFIDSSSLGNGIFFVWLMAILSLWFAKEIGQAISKSPLGGDLAALSLILVGIFRASSHEILTDLPFTTALLGLLWSILKLESRYIIFGLSASLLLIKEVGVIVLLFAAIYLVFIEKKKPGLIIALFSLPAVLEGIQLAYNYVVFGSAFFTGYDFWLSEDYKNLGGAFGVKYIAANLTKFFMQPDFPLLVIGILLIIVGQKKKILNREITKRVLTFSLFLLLPLLSIYLSYYWSEPRLYMPFIVFGAVLGGAAATSLFKEGTKLKSYHKLVILLLGIFLVRPGILITNDKVERLKEIINLAPNNAKIVTTENPVFVEYTIKLNNPRLISIEVIPLNRDVEYASKKVTKANEVSEVYKMTFDENPNKNIEGIFFFTTKKASNESPKI